MANRKLGRTSGHRAALFRNQLSSVLQHERIVTTLIKAKELRPIVEKMITLGKSDSVHNRRQAARTVADNSLVQKLFTDISPRFSTRPGGYTRIIKLGPRRGDGAEMAILEFVDYKVTDDTAAAPAPAKGGKKAAPKKEAAPAGEEAPKKAKKAAAPKADAGDDKPKKATRKKKEDAE
jgi:large subunit ribosomal protein L17